MKFQDIYKMALLEMSQHKGCTKTKIFIGSKTTEKIVVDNGRTLAELKPKDSDLIGTYQGIDVCAGDFEVGVRIETKQIDCE